MRIFPHLRRTEPGLAPVVDRLVEEHHAIHDVLEAVDRALVELVANPGVHSGLRKAVDLMTDTLLSHFAYEERELLGPLARQGMYPGSSRQEAARHKRAADRPCPWRRQDRNATLSMGERGTRQASSGSPSNVPLIESTSSPSES